MEDDVAQSYYTLLHAIFGEKFPDGFSLSEQDTEDLKSDLENILNGLSNQEGQLVALRFGLDDGTPRLQEEVAEAMGLSSDECVSLEISVIDRLRNPSRSQELRKYLD